MTRKNKRQSEIRGRMPDGTPNPVDIHVGNRLKLRRMLLGISQERLGSLIGLTFQQVQKYEHGYNRISASRLWDIANVLDVPISFFFEDMDKKTTVYSPRKIILQDEALQDSPALCDSGDPMNRKETLELVRCYYKIPNRQVAKNIFQLLISLSKHNQYIDAEDI